MVSFGAHFWNSGIFIWRVATILEELLRHRPGVLRPLVASVACRSGRPWLVPAAVMRRLPAVPIDRAVLEHSDRALMMRATFRWSDLGTWSALWEGLPKDRCGDAAPGRVMAFDAGRCLGVNPPGLTVFLGVNDLVVVRSGDIVLVLPRGSDQQVRTLVERLRRMGLAGHL
jgi:mannose-1-phosphate guanylyltransferase